MIEGVVFYVSLFLLGAAIGSFLGVVIDRLPLGKDFVLGRSRCDHCRRDLSWYELLPVISYLVQGGTSICCKKKLPLKYLILEIISGVVAVVVALSYGPISLETTVSAISAAILIYTLIAISFIDMEHGIIPDGIILFLLVLFVIVSGTQFIIGASDSMVFFLEIVERFITAVVASSFFAFLIYVTQGRGMGGGDFKLAFVLGLFLPGEKMLIAMYIAFLVGGIVAVFMLIVGKKRFGQTLPFGPFMALGGIVTVLYYELILEVYLTAFGFI